MLPRLLSAFPTLVITLSSLAALAFDGVVVSSPSL